LPARVYPASPGIAWEDLHQVRWTCSAGAALFCDAGGCGRASSCACATHPFVSRALLPHVSPPTGTSLREQSEGADSRSPAMRGNVWGDLSRCPRAQARRSTSFGLVPASTGGAHAVSLPPRHAEEACGGVPRVCPHLTRFRAAWPEAVRQPMVARRRRRRLWGPCCGSRARVRRVPCVRAQSNCGAAAPASVPHSHGLFSPR